MKSIFPDKISPKIPGILLISHGTLALGAVEAAEMILGETENLAALCFEGDCNPEDFGHKIKDTVEAFPAGCLVLVDLMGGTPFNQLMLEAPRDRYRAVCGMNLSMVAEVISNRADLSLEELAQTAVSAGTAGVVDVAAFLSKRMMSQDHSK